MHETGVIDFVFKESKVQSMGMEYPFKVEGQEIKIEQPMTTIVLTINDDGSLSNPMMGTFTKAGAKPIQAPPPAKTEGNFLSNMFSSTPARTDISYVKFREMTKTDLGDEWVAVQDSLPGPKNAGAKCSVEADIGAKLGQSFASAPRKEAQELMARALLDFMISQAMARPALRDAAKNLGLTKEGIITASLVEMQSERLNRKETDEMASRVALNLDAEGGLRQGVYKACVIKGPVIFR